jgi:hypothetical protein
MLSSSVMLPSFGEQEIDMPLRLFPCGEKSVANLVMTVLFACDQIAQALLVDDVEPVLAARVEGIDPDVDPARQLTQDVEVERRQAGQAEDAGAGGQAGLRRRIGTELFDPLEKRDGRVLAPRAKFGRDAPPERRLPDLVFGASAIEPRNAGALAVRPGRQPLRAVGDSVRSRLRIAVPVRGASPGRRHR